ncbi:hypothetical protein Q1695_005056 [Nippostrongylus brasiliensis]|nr:hypothetical protein Q1695_005056 [Nippostrongylus brasiliensis]
MQLLGALTLLIHLLQLVSATVKCYCTDDHCVPYGACDGAVCLVGILRENNQVIRTCGSRPLGCHSLVRYAVKRAERLHAQSAHVKLTFFASTAPSLPDEKCSRWR